MNLCFCLKEVQLFQMTALESPLESPLHVLEITSDQRPSHYPGEWI